MKRYLPLLALVALAGCGSNHATTATHDVPTHYTHGPFVHGREATKLAAPPPAAPRHLSSTTARVVPTAPMGPSGAWKVAYADAFAASIGSGAGQDAGWKANEHDQGCCNNGDEIAAERPSKVRTGEQGLEVLCTKEANAGRAYTCGGADTDTPAGFKWRFGGGQEWAFQTYAKAPAAANCGEDPGWWGSDPSWTDEFDFFEFWGWNSACRYSGGVPVWIYKTPSSTIRLQCVPWEGCATWIPNPEAWHTYTTVVKANNQVQEFIDGRLMGTIGPPSGVNTPWDHLIVTHALRERSILSGTSAFAVGYTAVYEIGTGNTEHAGVAPGTVVGETPPPPPPTTETTPPPPPPPPVEATVPHAPGGCTLTDHREGTTSWVGVACSPNASADAVTSYRLYRTGGWPTRVTASTPWWATGTSPSFANHELVRQGLEYCYRVSAVNAKGEGPRSDRVCVERA